MRQVVFLIITLGSTLLWLGPAGTASAICHHCQGRGGGCAECGEVGVGCGDCGGCARHHECCLNPLKAVKWVLRALGGSCACGGCDEEIYWGPYTRDCDPCDRCGNHRGGPAAYSRGYSSIPQGDVITSMPSAPSGGCNCNQGRVSHSAAPRPTSSYATARPSSGVRQEYGSAKRPAAPQGNYASRSSADPYAPRLISVTDEVVRPASPATRVATPPSMWPAAR